MQKYVRSGFAVKCALVLLSFLLMAPAGNAFPYSPGDLLLVFRREGFKDVIWNLGQASTLAARPVGNVTTIDSWDASVIRNNFNNNLAGVNIAVLAATSATDAERRVWISSGNLETTPTDLPGSRWGQLRSKIEFVGLQASANTETNSTPYYTVASSSPSAYSFIASDGGSLDPVTLGGTASFPVEATVPATLRWYDLRPSNATPKPAARLLGTFSFTAAGELTFAAGTAGATPEPLVAPRIGQISRSGNITAVTIASSAGVIYRLRRSDTLAGPVMNWTPASDPVSGTGVDLILLDTFPQPAGFYSVEASRPGN